MFNDFFDTLFMMRREMEGMTVEKKLLYLARREETELTIKDDSKTEEALNNLIVISRKSGVSTSDFLAMLSLKTDTDIYDFQAEKVTLMTMHAAKGLEFPIVFIVGWEKNYIPYQGSANEVADINEERRLFYVAMTRAKERLYLTWTKKRRIYGKQVKRELSPFAEDIEKRLRKHEESQVKKTKRATPAQLKLF
jgi:superfamily I DNA/RNA helicase